MDPGRIFGSNIKKQKYVLENLQPGVLKCVGVIYIKDAQIKT